MIKKGAVIRCDLSQINRAEYEQMKNDYTFIIGILDKEKRYFTFPSHNMAFDFQEGKLSSKDIMNCSNLELRRAMLENGGFEKIKEVCELEHFSDVGKLYSTTMFANISGENPVMKIYNCHCPTTGREYFIRVNPEVKTVEEAKVSTFPFLWSEYKKTGILPKFIFET